MAMLKRMITMGRTGGGLSYRSLSSGKYNYVDTLGMVKGLEAINIPSTQAEALTGVITSGLESVMEKVKADIAKSEEYQSARVAEEVRKMRADIATMHAEQRYLTHIHKVEQEIIKSSRDLKCDFDQLKAEFEATKYEVVKRNTYTLACVVAAQISMFCFMIL